MSTKRDWMWLFLFFGGLWLAGYVFYTYQPEEAISRLKQPFQQLTQWFQESIGSLAQPGTESSPPQTELPKTAPPQAPIAAPTLSNLELARQFLEKGDREQALIYLNQAVAEAATKKDAYLELGKISFTDKKWKQALEFFRQALLLSPDDGEAKVGEGNSLFQMALLEEAGGLWRIAYDHLKAAKDHPDPATWKSVWDRLKPRAEMRIGIECFLSVLRGYQKANGIFLKGWKLELPSEEARLLFLEAEREFKRAQSILEKEGAFLPNELAAAFNTVFRERAKSLKISTELAGSVPADSESQWQANIRALQLANESVGDAAAQFSSLLVQADSILPSDEVTKVREEFASVSKGVLVTLQR